MKKKEQKREEARARQAAYDAKPIEEKMKNAGRKEFAKLVRKMGKIYDTV